jgi:hypothetical protein
MIRLDFHVLEEVLLINAFSLLRLLL